MCPRLKIGPSKACEECMVRFNAVRLALQWESDGALVDPKNNRRVRYRIAVGYSDD